MRSQWMRATTGGVAFRFALIGMLTVGLTVFQTRTVSADSKKRTRVAKRVSKSTGGAKNALAPALKLARSSQAALAKVKDYEATFNKRERIGKQVLVQTTTIKLRERPFSVYMRFVKPHAGREVVYRDGQNEGKLLAHDTGLKSIIGTISLSPTSSLVMDDNRYPITMIGMSNMLGKVIDQWQAESKYKGVSVKYYPNAKLGDRVCQVIETSHSRQRSGQQFQMTRLYLEKKTNLPIRVEQFGFPKRNGEDAPLLEEYTYSNIKTNIGLTDKDFDTKNPKYGF